MKKIFSYLFFCGASLNMFASWDGSASVWTKGDGSVSNPYLIENEQNLAYLQQTVSQGETYAGLYFILASDLDMEGKVFNPIGFYDDYTMNGVPVDDSKPFLGIFDGNYHIIDNIIIELGQEDPDEIGGIGLFAVGKKGTYIKNLKLGKNVTVNANGSPDTGGIIGVGIETIIENCSFAGTVNGGSLETGGIIGYGFNTIVSGCVNTGNVIGNSFTGGIAGTLENSNISDCLLTGSVNGNQGYWVAGIIGWAYSTPVSTSVAIGKIQGETGTTFVPGISPICAELESSVAKNNFYVESLTGCNPISGQTGVKALTEEEMKSEATVSLLNDEDNSETWILSETNGFPTLSWTLQPSQAGVTTIESSDTVEIKIVKDGIWIASSNVFYTVTDLYGRVIAYGIANACGVKVETSKGIYFVTVRGSSGKFTTKKVII